MDHVFVIVGYGTMGVAHTKNLRALGVRVKGIVDIDPRAHEEAAAAGLHGYATLEDALADPDVTFLFIATPNEAHHPIALAALTAGKHVVCEKPAMLSSGELEEVMAASHRTGKAFIVHQNRRWDEDYLSMKKIHDEQLIGEVTFIETRIDGSRGIPGDWRRDPARGGGMVLDWGVHLVDRLLVMVPHDVTHVYARLSYVKGHEVEDGFLIYLTFANGLQATVACTTTNYIPGAKFHLDSRTGSATIDDWEMNGRVVRLVDAANDTDAKPILAGQGMTKTMAPRILDYAKMAKTQDNVQVLPVPRVPTDINDFYRNCLAVADGTAGQLVTNGSVLRCLRLLEAARVSHETGQVVEFEPAHVLQEV